jgi:hypothetical protein
MIIEIPFSSGARDLGSLYPSFARAVLHSGNVYLVNILAREEPSPYKDRAMLEGPHVKKQQYEKLIKP